MVVPRYGLVLETEWWSAENGAEEGGSLEGRQKEQRGQEYSGKGRHDNKGDENEVKEWGTSSTGESTDVPEWAKGVGN